MIANKRPAFKFSPLLKGITRPGSEERGWMIDIFGENPEQNPEASPVFSTVTEKPLVDVPESMQKTLPKKYFVRAKTVFHPEKSCRFRFGFANSGKGKMLLNGKEVVDLWTSQPPKTDDTACFNRLSMELSHDLDIKEGEPIDIEILLVNEDISGGVGTALTLVGRVGAYEVINTAEALAEAVELAKKVDVPIIMTGLSLDFEFENSDRKHLRLPPGVDDMIQKVLEANPNTVCLLLGDSSTCHELVLLILTVKLDRGDPVWPAH